MANRQRKNQQIKINSDAKEFASATFKKYKKHNGDYYDSKKELKESYNLYLVDLLPATIEFVVKYGHIKNEEIQTVKTEIYRKINDPDFIKIIKKEIKNGNKIENIKLLPIIIKEILMEIKRANDAALASDPNAKLYDASDLVELVQLILKKSLKKTAKAGIDSSLAFDVLMIIPCNKALEISTGYRVHSFFDCIYERAKTTYVPFATLMDVFVKESDYPSFITFSLLERKEKFLKLTDAQKTLYLEITSWCFDKMEKDLSKAKIEEIVNFYIKGRKRDDANGKDGNRRYPLSTLSQDDYPKITKIINRIIAEDDSTKKYL